MATGFSDIHPDIIKTHLLPRLDGCELATLSCVSATLRSLSTSSQLWSRICHDTWPSTNTPRLQQVISSFPNGPLSFFSLAFSLLQPSSNPHRPSSDPSPDTLISAVDLFYRGEPVLSKTQETETGTGWLRSAPFRIDLLDTKEVVPTPIPCPELDDETFHHLYRDLELSWILIDPIGRRAVNVSSMKPVSVHRHWLTGEVQAKFATVMEEAGGKEVLCVVEVTWAAVEAAEEEERLTVREVGLEVEDMDGIRLSGKDSMEIIQSGWEWGRRVAARGRRRGGEVAAVEGEDDERRKKYEEFMERRRERSERRKREEGFWDMVYISMAVLVFAALFSSFFWKTGRNGGLWKIN